MTHFIKTMILCSVTLLIILTGCNNNEKKIMFDEDKMYLGFNDINRNLTIEECESKGYVVIKELQIVANQSILEEFFKESNAKIESYIRFANFNDDSSNGMFYTDLIYDKDGYSYFYDDEEEGLKKEPYKYLHILKGKWGIPLKDDGMVVISDNKELTFHDVISSITSSMAYVNSAGSYNKIVLFNYGDFR